GQPGRSQSLRVRASPANRRQKKAQAPAHVPDTSQRPAEATLVVPGSVSMVSLLGSRDELLRTIEDEVDCDVHVRGNEITLTGAPAQTAFATRLFDELLALLGSGQVLGPDAVRRTAGM